MTSVEVWLEGVGTSANARVGIFYVISGNQLKCRSAAVIGALPAGSKQTVAVSLAVQVGDYIGFWDQASAGKDKRRSCGRLRPVV